MLTFFRANLFAQVAHELCILVILTYLWCKRHIRLKPFINVRCFDAVKATRTATLRFSERKLSGK